MAYFTRDEVEIIRTHRLDTTGYVLAESGDCMGLQEAEVGAVTGRKLIAVTKANLPRRRPGSWMLAVLLCPDDDTEALGAWAAKLKPEDLDRVVFYEGGNLGDLADVYAGWANAVYSDPNRFPVDGFSHLNRLLGLDLNRRILRDHQASPP